MVHPHHDISQVLDNLWFRSYVVSALSALRPNFMANGVDRGVGPC